MEKEQIKFTLSAFRPNSDDANDSVFTEALIHLEKDAELKAWFEQQMELNRALSDKLSEIEVPSNLRAQIAAGGSASRKPRRRQWMAIAAGFMLSAIGIAFALTHYSESGPKTITAYRVDMGTYLSKLLFLDFKTDKLNEIQDWLHAEHNVAPYTVPAPLQSRSSLGCEVVPWHERSSYLICFDVDGELVHLFVMPGGADVEGTPTGSTREYASVDDKWATLTWNDGGDLYLVATQGDKDFLAEALETQIAKAILENFPTVALR